MPSIICNICNRSYFDFERHVCGTPYEVVVDRESGGEVEVFYSTDDDLGEVACEYVERNFFSWDYPDKTDVEVRPTSNDDWKKFCVEVEPVPTFNAEEYKKHTCVDCGEEFESLLEWGPERCRKHRYEQSVKEYKQWKREQSA